MKGHKEQTKRLVALLKRHPVIVADIFEYGASGMLVPDIVKNISEFWGAEIGKANTRISDYYIWSMFHRRRPFHDSALYSQVSTENKERVSRRLYSTDPKFSLKDDEAELVETFELISAEEFASKRGRLSALMRVLSARQDYEDALDSARRQGMDIDAILDWIDIPLEDE